MTLLASLNQRISGMFRDDRYLEPLGPPPVDEPLIDLLPYRAWDQETGLYVNRASCGFMLEIAPLAGASEEMISLLTASFSDTMPDHASMQIMCWASPHVGELFDDWQRSRDQAPEVYRMLAAKRVDHFAGGGWSSPLEGTPHLLRNFRVFLAASLPGTLAATHARLTTMKRNVIAAMVGLGTPCRTIEPEGFLAILDEWLNPEITDRRTSPVWRGLDPLNHQLASAGASISVHPSRLILRGTHDIRCLTVQSYPEIWAQWQTNGLLGSPFSDFQRIPSPFLVSFSFRVGTDSSDSSRANIKSARSTQQADTEIARFMPMIREQAREWQYVAQKVREGHKLADSFYEVITYARLEEGDEAEQAVRSLYKTHGWRMGRDRYVQLQSFLAALPFISAEGMMGELKRLGRTKTPVTWTCANLAPLQGEWKGKPLHDVCWAARRARKYNGSLITGTQSVNDYYKNDAALASYENTDWICFLAQKSDSIEYLKKSGRISVDEAMERDMKSIRRNGSLYSEVMILGPKGYGIGRLMLDGFSATLFSSKASDFETIRRHQQAGLSLIDAVEALRNAGAA